jgi:hypothetical protein
LKHTYCGAFANHARAAVSMRSFNRHLIVADMVVQ